MNYETYENLLRVAENRRRQATARGDWVAVFDACNEIHLLRSSFETCAETEKKTKESR